MHTQPEAQRIGLSDTTLSAVQKLSEGNPGAITVLMEIILKGGPIDPQSAFKEWTGLMGLDSHGIYGSDIWVLYKDVCGQDLINLLAVLRAVQMGFLRRADVFSAIRRLTQLDIPRLRLQLKVALPQSQF